MNLNATRPVNTAPIDEDLIEQAQPGHGIPSQDPAAAAQFPLEPEDAEREANSVLAGGGLVAGAATGAAIGAVVAGPVGVVVGVSLGAVVGALGASAVGKTMNQEDASSHEKSPVQSARVHTEASACDGLPTAQVNKLIAASAPEIWTALTTPSALKQFFFGADVVTDWKVGSPIRMKGEFKGKAYEDKGDIVTFDPPRQLRFSHWSALSGQADIPANYHLVTFDLVPDGPATKVTLSQANLLGGVTASDIEHRADYEKNWAAVLDGLDRVLMHKALT
jgi:uncharacterized protein YndB with AHSA1/START domain